MIISNKLLGVHSKISLSNSIFLYLIPFVLYREFEEELNKIQYNYNLELIKYVSKMLFSLYKEILK